MITRCYCYSLAFVQMKMKALRSVGVWWGVTDYVHLHLPRLTISTGSFGCEVFKMT